MSKGPNPTIAVHLTQKELSQISRLMEWPAQHGELQKKITKAQFDIRAIVRDARREAKNLKATEEPYDGYMMGDDN